MPPSISRDALSKGNLLTKFPVHRITLKSQGHSTLGGRKVWFDPDVNRLNYDEHGRLLGEFFDEDQILIVLPNGDYYLSNFDLNNHYEDNILRIEKYEPDKVWTCVLFDADNQGYPYMKRFQMEATKRKQNFLGENPAVAVGAAHRCGLSAGEGDLRRCRCVPRFGGD